MDSINLVEKENLNQSNINLIMCKKCKREVDKTNTKRIFGQKNMYECKGDELKNCEEILLIEKEKEELKKEKEDKIINIKRQKEFDNEYLEYIIKNQDNFILLPRKFQYRDANIRYYDPEKKIIFKKHIREIIWNIDERMSEKNFEYLANSNEESSDESND